MSKETERTCTCAILSVYVAHGIGGRRLYCKGASLRTGIFHQWKQPAGGWGIGCQHL